MQPRSRSQKSIALTVGRILSGVGAALIRDSVDAPHSRSRKSFALTVGRILSCVGADLIRESVDATA